MRFIRSHGWLSALRELLGGEQSFHLSYSVANVTNGASFGIRDGDSELFFQGEEQAGGVETINGKFLKGAINGNSFSGYSFHRRNLGDDPGGQLAFHASSGHALEHTTGSSKL